MLLLIPQGIVADCIDDVRASEYDVVLTSAHSAYVGEEKLPGCVLGYSAGGLRDYAYSSYHYLCEKLKESVSVRISHSCCDGGGGAACNLYFGPQKKGVGGILIREREIHRDLIEELVENIGSSDGLLRGHAHHRLRELVRSHREKVMLFSDRFVKHLDSKIEESRGMSSHLLLLLDQYEKEMFPELLLQVMESRYILHDNELQQYLIELSDMNVDLEDQLERFLFLYGYIRIDASADHAFIRVLEGQKEYLAHHRTGLLNLTDKVEGSPLHKKLYQCICDSIEWHDNTLQKAYLDVKYPYQSFLCPYILGEKIDLSSYFIKWTELVDLISAIDIKDAYVNQQTPDGYHYYVSLRANYPEVMPVFRDKLRAALSNQGMLENLQLIESKIVDARFQYRFEVTFNRPLM